MASPVDESPAEALVAGADAGERGRGDSDGGAVDDGLDDGGVRHDRHPEHGVAARHLAGLDHVTVHHQRLAGGVGGARDDAEREAVDHVVEAGLGGEPQRAERG